MGDDEAKCIIIVEDSRQRMPRFSGSELRGRTNAAQGKETDEYLIHLAFSLAFQQHIRKETASMEGIFTSSLSGRPLFEEEI